MSLTYKESPWKERTQRDWTSLLELTIPLWSKYETTAAASSAYAAKVQAENEFRQIEKDIELNQNLLRKKISIAKENLGDAKKNLQRSKELYQDLLRSFRIGRISTNDLFLEQNRLLDSEINLSESQFAFHQTVLEICGLQGLTAQECLSSRQP